MVCAYCNALNPDGGAFCSTCGKKLVSIYTQDTLTPTINFSTVNNAPSSENLPLKAERNKNSRVLLIGAVVCLLLILFGTWGGYVYVNRSTPQKTLETISTALKANDFLTIYAQFSHILQSRLGSEQVWASSQQTNYKTFGGLTNSSVSSIVEKDSSASGLVTLTFGYGKSEVDNVTLTNENNMWVIDKTAVTAAKDTITEFPLPADNAPFGIASGPDGYLWFAELDGKIGRISTSGSLTDVAGTIDEFSLPTGNGGPVDITSGPDGNLWFTEWNEENNKIGRITPGGTVNEFSNVTSDNGPSCITSGPDDNLWFTMRNDKIGRITPGGTITEFSLPTGSHGPECITSGPDGNLWFTEAKKIGRITPGGTITEFSLPTGSGSPVGITSGPDGNLWFTEHSENKIGRMTRTGVMTEFPIPTSDSSAWGITTGPDGNLWFTESSGNKIGRMSISS